MVSGIPPFILFYLKKLILSLLILEKVVQFESRLKQELMYIHVLLVIWLYRDRWTNAPSTGSPEDRCVSKRVWPEIHAPTGSKTFTFFKGFHS